MLLQQTRLTFNFAALLSGRAIWGGGFLPVTFIEAIYTTSRIDQLLFTRKEGVTG